MFSPTKIERWYHMDRQVCNATVCHIWFDFGPCSLGTVRRFAVHPPVRSITSHTWFVGVGDIFGNLLFGNKNRDPRLTRLAI